MPTTPKMYDLEKAILTRHSVRWFLPTPIPGAIIREALELAQHAPSNSNTQPWRLFLASGAARDRLSAALMEEASQDEIPRIPALPPCLQHHRFEFGALYYGVGLGIRRGDVEARRQATLRNFKFFGAPLAGVVCMPKGLGQADSLGVGIWLQTLTLALEARGVGSCAQVYLAGYADCIRRELGIPEGMEVICGLSIGYADESSPANCVRTVRDSIDCNVTFICE